MADFEDLLHKDELELLIGASLWEFGRVPTGLGRLSSFRGRENLLYALPLHEYRSLRRAALRGLRQWMRAQARLHLIICVRFDYCRRREQPLADMARDLARALADIVPPPYCDYLAVALAKVDFLDAFCSCNVAKA